MKIKNPYTHLLEMSRLYVHKIINLKDIYSSYFDIVAIKNNKLFELKELYYKAQLAEKLGYNTVLKTSNIGLEVHFVAKIPDPPFKLLY